MLNPVVVAESPNKPNIKYVVINKPGTLEETFAPLVEEVRRNRNTTEKTIVFLQNVRCVFTIVSISEVSPGSGVH